MSPQAHQGTGLPAGNLLGLDHFTLRTSRLEQTVEFVKGLEGLTQRGEVLAVHCKAGNGRAGTIAGCWLLERGDCETAADAIRMVRQRRSAKAIQSYRQEKFIGAYEERLATVDFLSRRESMDGRRA